MIHGLNPFQCIADDGDGGGSAVRKTVTWCDIQIRKKRKSTFCLCDA